jgi:hypothetical protein
MSTDPAEKMVEESESELELAVRVTARPSDDPIVLARLLSAFDARRRSRETLALRESTRALQKLS